MSEQIKDGGQAFPIPNTEHASGHQWAEYGMTLRDYFAAKAMEAMLSSDLILKHTDAITDQIDDFHRGNWIAQQSFAFADCMLAAREAKS